MRSAEWSAAGSRPCRAADVNGGNWSNGSNAGLFNLNLNNAPSNANTNIGGRLANGLGQKVVHLRGTVQRRSFGAAVLSPPGAKINRGSRQVGPLRPNVAISTQMPGEVRNA